MVGSTQMSGADFQHYNMMPSTMAAERMSFSRGLPARADYLSKNGLVFVGGGCDVEIFGDELEAGVVSGGRPGSRADDHLTRMFGRRGGFHDHDDIEDFSSAADSEGSWGDSADMSGDDSASEVDSDDRWSGKPNPSADILQFAGGDDSTGAAYMPNPSADILQFAGGDEDAPEDGGFDITKYAD